MRNLAFFTLILEWCTSLPYFCFARHSSISKCTENVPFFPVSNSVVLVSTLLIVLGCQRVIRSFLTWFWTCFEKRFFSISVTYVSRDSVRINSRYNFARSYSLQFSEQTHWESTWTSFILFVEFYELRFGGDSKVERPRIFSIAIIIFRNRICSWNVNLRSSPAVSRLGGVHLRKNSTPMFWKFSSRDNIRTTCSRYVEKYVRKVYRMNERNGDQNVAQHEEQLRRYTVVFDELEFQSSRCIFALLYE